MKKIILILLISAGLFSCGGGHTSPKEQSANEEQKEKAVVELQPVNEPEPTVSPDPVKPEFLSEEERKKFDDSLVNLAVMEKGKDQREKFLIERSASILGSFKKNSCAILSKLADVANGVRFSPYGIADKTDRLFNESRLLNLGTDPAVYDWGNYDGSGDPIKLNFKDYCKKFILDKDYLADPAVKVSYAENTEAGGGFYKKVNTVTYKFPGTEKNGKMDWSSVTLVYRDYWLIAVIHDQWTI